MSTNSGYGFNYGLNYGDSSDTRWRIHSETDTIVASGLEATTPTVTDGTEIDVELFFYNDAITEESHRDRYKKLWPFMDINGQDVTRYGTSDVGTPWFRERLPVDSPVESLLVGVEPGDGIIDARGWWGLLVNVSDESEPVSESGGIRRVTATFYVLSRFGEFNSHTDVREQFGTDIV